MVMRLGGLASGIDTDTLIKQLMEAQRAPLTKLEQKKQLIEWQRDDYRAMNNKILDFRNAAFDMKLQSGYLAKKTVSSNDSIVSVTGSASANESQYTLKVNQLAKTAGFTTGTLGGNADAKETLANKLNFTGTGQALSATGNELTISGGKGSATIAFNANDSLDSLITSINAHSASTGIKANYDARMDRIMFTSAATGKEASIDLKMTDGNNQVLDINAAFKMSQAVDSAGNSVALKVGSINVTGSDAEVVFNGVTTSYSSNTFTIAGMTFTAKKTSDEVVQIGVTQDVDSVVDKIKNFVEKYNALIEEVNKELVEKRQRDYQPLTAEEREAMTEDQIKRWEEKARSGMLANDRLLSNGLLSLRQAFSDSVNGLPAGQLKNLSEIGISNVNIVGGRVTGDYGDRGKLYIDETKLRAALTDNPEQVMQLFTADQEGSVNDGIATRLYDSASALFRQITDKAGTSTSVENGYLLGEETIRLSDQMKRLTDRLADMETRYYKQFTAMETYLNKMNSQSAWLAQQFSVQ